MDSLTDSSAQPARRPKITEKELIETMIGASQRADVLPDTTDGDNERLNIFADICNEVNEYARTQTIFPKSVRQVRTLPMG